MNLGASVAIGNNFVGGPVASQGTNHVKITVPVGLLASANLSRTLTNTFLAMSNKPDFDYTAGAPDGIAGHTHVQITEPSKSVDFTLAVVNAQLGHHQAIDGCDSGCS